MAPSLLNHHHVPPPPASHRRPVPPARPCCQAPLGLSRVPAPCALYFYLFFVNNTDTTACKHHAVLSAGAPASTKRAQGGQESWGAAGGGGQGQHPGAQGVLWWGALPEARVPALERAPSPPSALCWEPHGYSRLWEPQGWGWGGVSGPQPPSDPERDTDLGWSAHRSPSWQVQGLGGRGSSPLSRGDIQL